MSEVTIPCRQCGRPMVERVNRATGSSFLGCSGWPDLCSETAQLPEYVKMIRAGAEELPGFGDEQ